MAFRRTSTAFLFRCALDADDSNAILLDELAKFLKRYTPPKRDKPHFGGKGFAKGGAFGAFQVSSRELP